MKDNENVYLSMTYSGPSGNLGGGCDSCLMKINLALKIKKIYILDVKRKKKILCPSISGNFKTVFFL